MKTIIIAMSFLAAIAFSLTSLPHAMADLEYESEAIPMGDLAIGDYQGDIVTLDSPIGKKCKTANDCFVLAINCAVNGGEFVADSWTTENGYKEAKTGHCKAKSSGTSVSSPYLRQPFDGKGGL